MADSQLRRVLDCGIVAVVRASQNDHLVEAAQALADGGVTVVEITMSVPNALDVLRQVRQALGDRVLLGAGTVLDAETARAVLLAGAEFIVAPTLNLDVIRLCRRYDKLVIPGAFTPTEILTASRAAAANPVDANRRGRPDHCRRLSQSRRLLSRHRRPTR